MTNTNYSRNVFINCPFDSDDAYQPLEDIIIFTITDCGFVPRSAKESSASGNRIEKIEQIIEDCCYAIHDISRTEPDSKYNLPRFNMPFELGLFLGAHRFGDGQHEDKKFLIFDKNAHRYEKFISDIKGHDIHGHNNKPRKLIDPIRNFLAESAKDQKILLPSEIHKRYLGFQQWMQKVCYKKKSQVSRKDLSFGKFSQMISEFLEMSED